MLFDPRINDHSKLYSSSGLRKIFSLVKFSFRKKGAIRGPVAPTKIDANPLILPTLINDFDFFSILLLDLIKRYQIIKTPIIGFKKSTFISLAELTWKYFINKIISMKDTL